MSCVGVNVCEETECGNAKADVNLILYLVMDIAILIIILMNKTDTALRMIWVGLDPLEEFAHSTLDLELQ